MSTTPDRFLVKGGTDPVEIRGTAKYSKLMAVDMYGKHSLTIYPDQESMNRVHKLISEGVKNKIRKDDDGYCITFSRPTTIKTKTKGEVALDPVRVVDKNNRILSDKAIPDGEDITMTLECYGGKSPTGFGTYKAARLLSVKRNSYEYQEPPF